MNEFQTEIEAAIRLVEQNYAGYADKRARLGAEVLEGAATRARNAATQATSLSEFDRILYDYVSVFQEGHLVAASITGDGEITNLKRTYNPSAYAPKPSTWTNEPRARTLSPETFLLTVPSFDLQQKATLDGLLAVRDAEIKVRPNLIIDVRGNGGGSDDTYSALRPYLYTQPITQTGTDVLATRASADAWESMLAQAFVTDEEFVAHFNAVMEKMRSVPEGTFIPWNDDSMDTFDEVFPRPAKVAVLINRDCGSTTEQFLLEARQSKKVALYGETTAGVLDYSNMRTFKLPSGNRVLGIATTRSRRLPDNPVDGIGIEPDVIIPNLTHPQSPDDNAIELVKAAIERQLPVGDVAAARAG